MVEDSRKPQGYWTKEAIETEAINFYAENKRISLNALMKNGRNDLRQAIQTYYPGSISALKQSLDIEDKKEVKPPNYWSTEKIEEEALTFSQTYPLTHKDLLNNGRTDLLKAITNKYPGSIISLRAKLKTSEGTTEFYKPKGYWTPEQIEKEAKKFLKKEGDISVRLLLKKGKHRLQGVISQKYPGGFKALKEKLNTLDLNLEEQLLEEYDSILLTGEPLRFYEFLRRKQDERG